MWCIPPESDAEFVCAMENVLAVYKRPFDPSRPVVCFDEKSKQLIGEIATNLFMFVEPLRGWRHVSVTSRWTKLDFAQQMKELVDVHYPNAEKITLVMDNLNTHKMSCLYEAFAPEVARRIVEKIEVIHTPKHGSWLNMAECELSVLEKQCLGGRVADHATLDERIGLWESDRNNRSKKINWQFKTADARIKLRRLYPQIQMS